MLKRRKLSYDLLLIIIFIILANTFVLIPSLSTTIIRAVLGLPLVLFLPGYALIAALFPARSDLDGIERTALSFGLSIAVIPLIGLGLNYTPWGIRLLLILISLSGLAFFMCVLTYLRRAKLPETDAFEVPFREMTLSLKDEILDKSESKLDKTLTIIPSLSILLSIATLVYVVVTPKEGEHCTELYILGPEGVADNYPTNYTLGENGTVIVGIVNHEYRLVNYTMEVRLQNRSLSLPENQRQVSLAHNETWEEPVTIAPSFEGNNMKLGFLLYNESEKNIPYRDLHLWINVSEAK